MIQRLAVLLGILTVFVLAAAPAFAQGQVTATGVLPGPVEDNKPDPAPTFALTDEKTGTEYELASGFVELKPYAGERILVYGVPVPGSPPPGSPRLLNVTQVEPLDSSGETVTVTFELKVEGDIAEGQTLALRLDRGETSRFYEGPAGDVVFCATGGNPSLPVCEDGKVYSGTLQVPADEPITFEYVSLGTMSEVFDANTKTFAEDSAVRAVYNGDTGEPAMVTATFELKVEGEPPTNATFFGYLSNGGGYVPVRLADPDGNGVYTGSYDQVGQGDSLRVLVVQGTGTRSGATGVYAGEPTRTVKDFGDVVFEEDETLTYTVSFEGSEPKSLVDVNEDGSVDEADGEAAAKITDSAAKAARDDGQATLPVTGGVAIDPLVAGLSLTVASLLARRVFS